MSEQPKKRPWLQFSLATAIVMMFVAGGLMWLNSIQTIPSITQGDSSWWATEARTVSGWPFPYHNHFARPTPDHEQYEHMGTEFCADLTVWFWILFLAYLAAESRARRDTVLLQGICRWPQRHPRIAIFLVLVAIGIAAINTIPHSVLDDDWHVAAGVKGIGTPNIFKHCGEQRFDFDPAALVADCGVAMFLIALLGFLVTRATKYASKWATDIREKSGWPEQDK